MPRLEEVQFVNWGSLRPDPVPLLVDGINVATGPNGSGKTCFLDGIKVLLGITALAPGRSSAKYIFDGGSSGAPAEHAWLRATFANPTVPDGSRRLFEPAGGDCAEAEQVTVACLVTREERRYRVFGGRLRWGVGRPIQDDLDGFMAEHPAAGWLGPRAYEELLERIGITHALREVLALPQGTIDRIVEEKPPGLLRKLLSLTGKGALLESLSTQREGTGAARDAYLEAIERYRAEQDRLDEVSDLAARHLEWAGLRERLELLRQLARPAAEYRDFAARVSAARDERDEHAATTAADQEAVAELSSRMPVLESKAQALADDLQAREAQVEEAAAARRAAETRVLSLRAKLDGAKAAMAEGTAVAGGRNQAAAEAEVAEAEARLNTVLARRREVATALARCQDEVVSLSDGRPLAPPEVEEFRAKLAAHGIQATVVAEVVALADEGAEDAVRARAEAALGDSLWALVVASHDYREATALAVQHAYRHGIGRAGAGEPTGALAAVLAPPELGLLLERADALAALDPAQAHGLAGRGRSAVAPDGMRYGDSLTRLQAPEQPVLGRIARERRLAEARLQLQGLGSEEAELGAQLQDLRAHWHRAVHLLDTVRALPERQRAADTAERELQEAEQELSPLAEQERRLQQELRQLDAQRGAAGAELALASERLAETGGRLEASLPRLEALEATGARLARELEARRLTPEQEALLEGGDLPGTESLLRDSEWLTSQVDDQSRFGADARDPAALTRREEQARLVDELDAEAEARKAELDELEARVEGARRRLDERIREAVAEISAEFGRICQIAGAAGEVRLVPGEGPEAYGVDVLVSDRPGERKRSYRDAAHSGGQRATIAILLLLAAMGSADAADLLLMDEHIAHLDSTNIDHVAKLMHALADRVQFVLATPTNAEALRLSWCDLQLAFLPRDPGRPYSPPIRLLSRLGVGDLETRFPERVG